MKRIALLGPAGSVHLARWANGLLSRGLEVHVLTVHPPSEDIDPRVHLHRLPGRAPIAYFTAARALKRCLREIQPDLVNVHYATGYGMLARLAAFRPLLVSVWGSDIYMFPEKGRLHRSVLSGNLRSATAIASTSRAMANKLREYENELDVFITPFGVDENVFRPLGAAHDSIVIGTAKKLEPIYGIDTLIEAFALLRKRVSPALAPRLRLLIAGAGIERARLEKQCRRLGIAGQTEFRGFVPHGEMSACLAEMDVFVALSRLESFGVSILEAGACGIPSVVSDADGPREVTVEGVTGYVVPRENAEAAAERLVQLVTDTDLRRRMGEAARLHVQKNYSWQTSLDRMLEAYDKTLDLHGPEKSCELAT